MITMPTLFGVVLAPKKNRPTHWPKKLPWRIMDQNQLMDHQSWTDHHGKFHEKNAFLGLLEKCRTHFQQIPPTVEFNQWEIRKLSKVTKQIQKLYFRFGQSIRSPQRNRTPLPYLPQQSWGHTASRVFFGFVQSLRMWVKECHKTHHPAGKSP